MAYRLVQIDDETQQLSDPVTRARHVANLTDDEQPEGMALLGLFVTARNPDGTPYPGRVAVVVTDGVPALTVVPPQELN